MILELHHNTRQPRNPKSKTCREGAMTSDRQASNWAKNTYRKKEQAAIFSGSLFGEVPLLGGSLYLYPSINPITSYPRYNWVITTVTK